MADSNWGLNAAPLRLDELRELARVDLEALKPGVLLEWATQNARAVGVLEEARVRVEHLDRNWRDKQWRLNAVYPPTAEQREQMEATGPGVETLIHWHERLREAAAAVKFTEHVLALLERALRQRAAKKDHQQPQKQRPRAA